jgi:hypothetical protein
MKTVFSGKHGKTVILSIAGAVILIAAVTAAVLTAKGKSNDTATVSAASSSSDVSDSGTFAAADAIQVTSGSTASGVTSSSSVVSSTSTVTVAATSIKLNKESITLNVGDSAQIAYAILPTNTTDVSVSWDSSDRSIADINTHCTITAVSAGTATIKVTASNGKSDTCAVTVKAASTGKSASTASKSGTSKKVTSATTVPKAAVSAVNAAGITDYANYGFSHGVSATNTQVLTENWDFDTMVSDVTKGIELGDTVNYANIPSSYRSQMLYYGGATSGDQKATDDWISEVKNYHINETCEFTTSKSDIYQNFSGEMIVRGKETIHIISADKAYYSSLDVSGSGTYYRVIDVIIATGAQNGYGISQSMYSINGAYHLSQWESE